MRAQKLLLPGLVAAFLLMSCDPDPVRMKLLTYSRTADSYSFQTVTLETITDLDSLEGTVARILARAAVTLNYNDNTLTWKRAPRTVSFAWYRDGDIVVPEDFDSFSMASIYYNLELAASFFEELGLDESTLGQMPVYYNTKFVTINQDDTRDQWKDNALFIALTPRQNAFFILPFELFEWIPLALNTGIVTHEYAHAVFNELVFDSSPILSGSLPIASRNFLSSINEGFADFMAVAKTGDPDFMEPSIPKGLPWESGENETVEISRDASDLIPYTSELDHAARTTLSEYNPYPMGAFLAAYLYAVAVSVDGTEAGEQPSMDTLYRIATLALEAIGDLGQTTSSNIDMADVLSLFVGRCINPEDRAMACDIANQRASLILGSIDGC